MGRWGEDWGGNEQDRRGKETKDRRIKAEDIKRGKWKRDKEKTRSISFILRTTFISKRIDRIYNRNDRVSNSPHELSHRFLY